MLSPRQVSGEDIVDLLEVAAVEAEAESGSSSEDGEDAVPEGSAATTLGRALLSRSLVGQCCIPTAAAGSHHPQGTPRALQKVAVVESDPRGFGVGLGGAREEEVGTGPEALQLLQRGLAHRGKTGHKGRTT